MGLRHIPVRSICRMHRIYHQTVYIVAVMFISIHTCILILVFLPIGIALLVLYAKSLRIKNLTTQANAQCIFFPSNRQTSAEMLSILSNHASGTTMIPVCKTNGRVLVVLRAVLSMKRVVFNWWHKKDTINLENYEC